jgi:hypothetical protein
MSNESITITYPSLFVPSREMSFFLASTDPEWIAEVVSTIEDSAILKDFIFYLQEDWHNIDTISWNMSTAEQVQYIIVDFNNITLEKIAFITNFAKTKKTFVFSENTDKNLESLCFYKSQAVYINTLDELGEFFF